MARQAVILTIVCGMHKNLKALLEHDRCQKVIGCGGVWCDNEQRHLFVAGQLFQMNGIIFAYLHDGRNIERTHTHTERYVNTLCGFVRCHMLQSILARCE